MTGSAPQDCDIIVRNGQVLTMNPERMIYAQGAVAISKNAIAGVGSERDVLSHFRAARLIDAQGAVVHPGFIDAHLHINAHTCRGVFKGDPSLVAGSGSNYADWKAALQPEDERAAAMLGCVELLRHGFTCFIEPGTAFEPDAVADAAQAVGVRCTLADPYLWDNTEVLQIMPGYKSESLFARVAPNRERCLKLLGSQLWRNHNHDGVLHGHIALYGEGTASTELMKAAQQLADSEGVICNHHLGFDIALAEAMEERWGKPRLVHLADLGLLRPNTTLVHMNVLRNPDIEAIVTSGLSVVWCPIPYLFRGTSIKLPTRIPELKARGVPVALGTDSARSWTVGDASIFAFHLAAEAGNQFKPGEVLEMKTLGAAHAAGLGKLIGSLEPGKRADLVIRSRAAEQQPCHDPLTQLEIIGHGPGADTVIVNGDIVLRHGSATRVDEAEVGAEARASVNRMVERLGLGSGPAWPVLQ